eukprot:TRINITY_DN1765_c0_g1_i8.p1 TRINITY_DN1765_c0_g1~~TRINITY_DN1765_c0_g1_i8.p1  ORF type:complete len:398 (+),score=86.57 TRINITY_DN1765_c0_g1_i8:1187-2380(+)
MGKRVDTAGFEELGSATLNELLVNWVDTKQPFSGDYNCVTVAAQALHNKGWLDKTITNCLLWVLRSSRLSNKRIVETTRVKLLRLTLFGKPKTYDAAVKTTQEVQRLLGAMEGNVFIAYTEGADNTPHASLFVHYNPPRAVGEGLEVKWVRLDVGGTKDMQYGTVYCVDGEDEETTKHSLCTLGLPKATLNELLVNWVDTQQDSSGDFNCATVVAQALLNKGWLDKTVTDRLVKVLESADPITSTAEETRVKLRRMQSTVSITNPVMTTKLLRGLLGDVEGNVCTTQVNSTQSQLSVFYDPPCAVGEGLKVKWVRLHVDGTPDPKGMKYGTVCWSENEMVLVVEKCGGRATLNKLLHNWVSMQESFGGDFNCVEVSAQANSWLDAPVSERLLRFLLP